MTGLNHGMTGAVIAISVKNPLLAVPLSFVSHFVQDTLPHWDYGISRKGSPPEFFSRKFNRFLAADFLLSITLMVILALTFPSQKWLIWACMIAAASPDLMWAYYRLHIEHIKKKQPNYDLLARFHILVQWSQMAKGAWVELLWFIITGAIILGLR